MSASAAEVATARSYSCFARLKFGLDSQGARVASPVAKGSPHDLRGPVENSGGTRVQTLLSLDVDVKGSDLSLLDGDRLDVGPFLSSLRRDLPYCASLLRYVVRTPGGGFHPSFTIVPIPLIEETLANQRLFLVVQELIARYLVLVGYNTDRSAFGLGKTYASPENTDRLLYKSEKDKAWTLKCAKVPVLTKMRDELENALGRFSVYQGQVGTEAKFARLFMDLFDGGEGHSLECSIGDLHTRTGIGAVTLRRIVHREPLEKLPWLKVEAHAEYGRFTVSLDYSCPDVAMIWARASFLSQASAVASPRKGSGGQYGVGALVPPELVCDGARNAALRNYAYVLKHAGVACEVAVEALYRLAQSFPSSEGSRHRRLGHIRDIVRCFYRRHQALFPLRFHLADLPRWLREALPVLKRLNVPQCRGNSRPACAAVPVSPSVPLHRQSPPKEQNDRKRGYGLEMAKRLTQELCGTTAEGGASSSSKDGGDRVTRLYAVPYRNRIGIFDGDRLVLCVTRCRNYVPSRVSEYIQTKVPEYKGSGEIVVRKLRKGTVLEGAIEKIAKCPSVLPSRFACGAAETLGVSLARWRERKGIEEVIARTEWKTWPDEETPF